nr:transposase [Aspergillus niger CBS 513.88]|eukprot:XP_001398056.2 transposase [Aspergillus niger CBS 513.88]
MPKSSKELVEQEGRLCLAVESIQKGHTKSIREAARVFQVPRSTLQDRLNGLKFRKDTRANSHKLTSIEEESLEKWIISLDQPIQMWFKRVQTAISTYGIVDEDIYNFDETGFAMGILGTTKVVIRSTCQGRPFLIQPGNREWITSIECINAAGWVLPAYLVLKAKTHIQAWYEGSLPSSWRIAISSNGWTTREIGEAWLKDHFIPYIKTRRTGQYSLLVLDGHDSHLTPQFDDICYQNQIIPVCMPANSSHLCQPLDVACFSPLKKAYKDQVQQLIRTGYHHIEKVDFLDMYPKAHAQAFTKANIQSAFRASGLVPLDPSKILENMIFKETSRPSSQSTSSSSIFTKTPRNSRQFKKYESTLSQLLQQQDTPATPIQSALSYIFKGAEVALNHTVLLEHENRQLREALDKRNTKQKRNQHQMDGLNGLTVQEALEAFNHARILEEQAGDAGPREDQPRRRAPPRCSACHIVGHIRTRCPNRAVS